MSELIPMITDPPGRGFAALTPGVVVVEPELLVLDGVEPPQADSRTGPPAPTRASPAAPAAPRPRNVLRSYRSAESATSAPSGRPMCPGRATTHGASAPSPAGPGVI